MIEFIYGTECMTIENSKVVSIWRYPVKSMMGEEMNACDVTSKGLLGDRAYALVDTSTGKLANAKNPKKWPNIFDFRASFVEPPVNPEQMTEIRITFPDGSMGISSEEDLDERISTSFNRQVHLVTPSSSEIQFEEYVPDLDVMKNKDSVVTYTTPQGTFFDAAMVHIITTATINHLRSLIPESRIEVRRFRPNIVLDVPDGEGFIENEWIGKRIRIGEIILEIEQPTVRCVMTTLPQGDLPQDSNVLRTAIKQNNGAIGVYAKVIQAGRIRRGDTLEFM